jgi:molecular chaperone GrpE
MMLYHMRMMVSHVQKPKRSDPSADSRMLGQRVKDLEAELSALRGELGTFRDLAARAQADLQNAKLRVEKEREDVGHFARETSLRRLIPILDHFQRAMRQVPEHIRSYEWVRGIAAIEQDFFKQVTEMGLAKIEAIGKPFDPLKHEMLFSGPGEEGKIIEVFEDGYELHGKVLRPAKVKVGQGKQEAEITEGVAQTA